MINNLFISNNVNYDKPHKISRGLVTGAVILTLSLLPGCSYNASAVVNPNVALEEVSDTTCFDEVLEDNIVAKIKMDLLEEYLDASDDLHSLKLDKEVRDLPESGYRLKYTHIENGVYYNSDGEEVSREEFISLVSDFMNEYGISADEVDDYPYSIDYYYYIEGINEMIEEVQLLKEFKKEIGPEQDRYYYDCIVLNNEETKVNGWLRDVGYGATSDYGLLLIKSKCCDACDYDEEHYSEFVVSPYDAEFGAYVEHTGDLGNTTRVKLGSLLGGNDLAMVSLDVTNSQDNERRASFDEDDASYSKERNQFFRNIIGDYTKVIGEEYQQKGAYIKLK